ncbi:ADP-ribosylglycohydrolase family protein [Streptomyces sp. NBC_00589]|nr:ADP-ribosylglycohydrolase family protein [Streptomyces sp. NBC_00589]WTI39966.1 ADP-ribosylglycohydrolase family protein [Streptomyces sp. NBC_00775]WUB26354.1 ADP-ribosylglycohydrolase family protein [Streptomyces sp. NBC_00589]
MPTLLTEPLGTTGPGTEEQPLTAALLTEPPGTEEQPLTATPATEPPGTAAPLAAAPGTKLSSAEEPLAGALSTVPPDAAAPRTATPVAAAPRMEAPTLTDPRTETPTSTDPRTEVPALTDPRAEAPPRTRLRRIEGLLLGLAAGDAAGWPAARHRAARMPEWTRRLTRELDTFAEQNATTTLPVPIALNQPPEPLRLGPSDDAEWAAFAAEAVLRAGEGAALGDLSRERRMRASIDLSWNAIASEVAAAAERAPEVESALLPLRARISVRAGLGNLATGLRPPATGHDNPHYFDDAACVRACVLAVAHPGDPRLAAELAEFDARYTQDGDGVHGARAMAAAVSLALAGADVDACVNAALAELPASTEIGRNTRHALRLARESEGTFALVPLLEHQIVDHVYSYGIAAAETVPVALALATAAQGRIAEAVPAAACLSRVADSAPALAGALTGALGGGATIPAAWRDACRTLSGCALPRLTGTDLIGLADLLEATELATPEG